MSGCQPISDKGAMAALDHGQTATNLANYFRRTTLGTRPVKTFWQERWQRMRGWTRSARRQFRLPSLTGSNGSSTPGQPTMAPGWIELRLAFDHWRNTIRLTH
jgi:hypothetical protein